MEAPFELKTPPRPAPAPTRLACEAATLIGYAFDDEPTPPRRTLRFTCAPGSITLITGPSGAGKTTLLREASEAARERGWRVIDANRTRLGNRTCVDLAGDEPEAALRRLSQAGLADAHCLARRPRDLSMGQRARLALAVALRQAEQTAQRVGTALIVVDEFAAMLDRATAHSVAATFGRAVRAAGVRAIVATAHQDLASALRPTNRIEFDANGNVRVSGFPASIEAPEDRYEISVGDVFDYAALAPLHYRAGAPASVVRTLRAIDARTGEVVGALVVTMPTLNGAWRDMAWPGRYTTGDKRLNARRLNREVRRIARVVVDPRHRGVGVARRLTQAYLEDPLTPCTEALSAMGVWSRFFERAGMTAHALPILPRDARLLDALAHAGVERFRLATPRSAWRRAVEAAGEEFMRRELLRWSQDRGHETSRLRSQPDELWRRACKRIGAQMMAFTFGEAPEAH